MCNKSAAFANLALEVTVVDFDFWTKIELVTRPVGQIVL